MRPARVAPGDGVLIASPVPMRSVLQKSEAERKRDARPSRTLFVVNFVSPWGYGCRQLASRRQRSRTGMLLTALLPQLATTATPDCDRNIHISGRPPHVGIRSAETSGVPASPFLAHRPCLQDVRRTTERDMWVVAGVQCACIRILAVVCS